MAQFNHQAFRYLQSISGNRRAPTQLKKVEYDYLEEEIGGKSELLLKSNPVLIHCGHLLCESFIIVQDIDEAWSVAPGLVPARAHDGALRRGQRGSARTRQCRGMMPEMERLMEIFRLVVE